MNGNSSLDNICFLILTHSLPPSRSPSAPGLSQAHCAFPSESTHLKISNSGHLLWRNNHLQHGETELHMKNVYTDCLSHEFLKPWGTEGGFTFPPLLPILKTSLMHHMTLSSSNASLRNLIKTWFSPFDLLHEQHIHKIIQN